MKKIGITGERGFIGSYLYNRLSLLKDEFELVPFTKEYFNDQEKLSEWTNGCDVIVHLAALNRHPDQNVIHNTNVKLVDKLIDALATTSSKKQIIFSSSTQEERDNLYGKSKREGREKLADWAKQTGNRVTGLIIPNVFGPFGKPFYNSVVATFCYQLVNNEEPKIDHDGELKLIYVDELATVIIEAVKNERNEAECNVPFTKEIKVSAILSLLKGFKDQYFDKGIIPQLDDRFSINLFNTFRSFINHKERYPFKYQQHTDNRGKFVELIRLSQGGQVSFSTTVPGITRGNHFHTRKIERFSVIKGKALIQLRKYNTDEVLNFELNGEESSYVDMPVWYTHNIKNIGDDELYTVFWINEFYNPEDPDTYFENV